MATNIKVLMLPHKIHFRKEESGIRRVVESYFKYLPDFGIELVNPNDTSYDLKAIHAGATGKDVSVAHLHGIYWSEDYQAPNWEFSANRNIVDALRVAAAVTVPSEWVSENIKRDMRFSPFVIPHGIEWEDWQKPEPNMGYVLWNKNRNMDVCDPTPMANLAKAAPRVRFLSTYVPDYLLDVPHNIEAIGLKTHSAMKTIVQRASVYLSTTKETFGIGVLEALACGVPVLGFNWGGNQALVQHGVNGYLADSEEELVEGLAYCLEHRQILSDNARLLAKQWNWPDAVEKIAGVYRYALQKMHETATVSVIIPCYNHGEMLKGAVESVLKQTRPVDRIIIIDDGSTDSTQGIGQMLAASNPNVEYRRTENHGVANARNEGIRNTDSKYVVCLDADDRIADQFIEACVSALEADRSLGVAYTGLNVLFPDGHMQKSDWPGEFNYDVQITPRGKTDRGNNQIPTCAMFRREAWVRTGGYKQRYAPLGAGSEDADFWTRIGSIGYGAKLATTAPLFIHSQGTSSGDRGEARNIDLVEPPWLTMHPWVRDGRHPFASQASPKNGLSHPVRQYDLPTVSVVIPVGEGHEKVVQDALDTLEAQSYRSWEAIVAWDSPVAIPQELRDAYPYVRFVTDPNAHWGAGEARNQGAKIARGQFLVFLDADDELLPKFLQSVMDAWMENPEAIIYTDYINEVTTTRGDLANFIQKDVLSFDERRGLARIAGRSASYDCEAAQSPLNEKRGVYHWCLVTCLIPRAYFEAIGGFDSSMETFEDVLFHWKLARRGYCYTRIEEPLVVYRMDTSTRRRLADPNNPDGLQVAQSMLKYAEAKLKEVELAACKTCPGNRVRPNVNVIQEMESALANASNQSDPNYIMVEYIGPRGKHNVVGVVTRIDYGYRGGGERFLVHRDDIQGTPQYFREIDPSPQPPQVMRRPLAPPPNLMSPEPEAVPVLGPSAEDDTIPDEKPTERPLFVGDGLDIVPGITKPILTRLQAAGITTKSQLLTLGKEGLMGYNVPEETAADILASIASFVPKTPVPTT